jgi:hypothetical protein
MLVSDRVVVRGVAIEPTVPGLAPDIVRLALVAALIAVV